MGFFGCDSLFDDILGAPVERLLSVQTEAQMRYPINGGALHYCTVRFRVGALWIELSAISAAVYDLGLGRFCFSVRPGIPEARIAY